MVHQPRIKTNFQFTQMHGIFEKLLKLRVDSHILAYETQLDCNFYVKGVLCSIAYDIVFNRVFHIWTFSDA